jgi:hypothetical protein
MRLSCFPPAQFAKQHLGNRIANVRLFLSKDFLMDSSMRYLMESFYYSIREGAPVPIPYWETPLTTRIMGEILNDQEISRSVDLPGQPVARRMIFRFVRASN